MSINPNPNVSEFIFRAFALLSIILWPLCAYLGARLLVWKRKATGYKAAHATLMDRCRSIMFVIENEFPELKNARGENLVRGVQEKIASLRAKRSEAKGAIHTIGSRIILLPPELEMKAQNLIGNFAVAMANKLLLIQNDLLDGERLDLWAIKSSVWPIPIAQERLLECVAKGDPVDVANFAAFLWHHEEETSLMGYMSVTPTLLEEIQLAIQARR